MYRYKYRMLLVILSVVIVVKSLLLLILLLLLSLGQLSVVQIAGSITLLQFTQSLHW